MKSNGFLLQFSEYTVLLMSHVQWGLPPPGLYNVDISTEVKPLGWKHHEPDPFNTHFLYYSVKAGSWTGMSVEGESDPGFQDQFVGKEI